MDNLFVLLAFDTTTRIIMLDSFDGSNFDEDLQQSHRYCNTVIVIYVIELNDILSNLL